MRVPAHPGSRTEGEEVDDRFVVRVAERLRVVEGGSVRTKCRVVDGAGNRRRRAGGRHERARHRLGIAEAVDAGCGIRVILAGHDAVDGARRQRRDGQRSRTLVRSVSRNVVAPDGQLRSGADVFNSQHAVEGRRLVANRDVHAVNAIDFGGGDLIGEFATGGGRLVTDVVDVAQIDAAEELRGVRAVLRHEGLACRRTPINRPKRVGRRLCHRRIVHGVAVELVALDGAGRHIVLENAQVIADARRASRRPRRERDIEVLAGGGRIDIDLVDRGRGGAAQSSRLFPGARCKIVGADALERADPHLVIVGVVRHTIDGVAQEPAPRVLRREVIEQGPVGRVDRHSVAPKIVDAARVGRRVHLQDVLAQGAPHRVVFGRARHIRHLPQQQVRGVALHETLDGAGAHVAFAQPTERSLKEAGRIRTVGEHQGARVESHVFRNVAVADERVRGAVDPVEVGETQIVQVVNRARDAVSPSDNVDAAFLQFRPLELISVDLPIRGIVVDQEVDPLPVLIVSNMSGVIDQLFCGGQSLSIEP